VQLALDSATTLARSASTALALLYVDLDGFKRINDSLGHAAGDELLRQLAGRLERIIRPGDVLARQGGDEFLVLLDGLHREPGTVAADVARRIVAAVDRPFVIAETQVQVGASVGVSLYPRDAGDPATLLQHADTAMYRAKAGSGSRWVLFGSPLEAGNPVAPPPPAAAEAPQVDGGPEALAAAFQAIVAGQGLRSLFQPLVELDSGDVFGYEALARGPEGSPFARPDALFAYARGVGRLGELDWACRAAALEGALEGSLPSPLRLFINVEPEALGTPCPPQHQAIWDRAADLEVVVEVTERALTARPADLLHELESFRDRGWAIALDDVGADSRSLALLSLLRPDVVKLDLRLIQDRPTPKIAEIVTAVNAYAERTGAVLLAEGIENEAHIASARAIGATHGQGWSFGRPAPLPAGLASTARPLSAVARASHVSGTTPYEVVSQRLPIRRATKPLLLEMSWHLERQALELGETAVLVAAFQTAERFTPATRRRYSRLASRIAFVAALGVGLDAEPAPGVRGATLTDDDSLADEWSVAVIGPHFAGALVAVDLGDDGLDEERRFDFAITYDRELVMDATTSLMRRVLPVR
jgi:diguanylate cyclase (GGDEF)-like protein